eukprot:386194_1
MGCASSSASLDPPVPTPAQMARIASEVKTVAENNTEMKVSYPFIFGLYKKDGISAGELNPKTQGDERIVSSLGEAPEGAGSKSIEANLRNVTDSVYDIVKPQILPELKKAM